MYRPSKTVKELEEVKYQWELNNTRFVWPPTLDMGEAVVNYFTEFFRATPYTMGHLTFFSLVGYIAYKII